MRRRAQALLAAAVLIVALIPGAASGERTLALSTGSFEFNVAAGQSGSGEVIVMNPGDETLDVLIYAGNQVIGPDGKPTFDIPAPGTPGGASNPASWLQVRMSKDMRSAGNVPFITLKPKERVPVHFDFTVPEDVPPGDHQILLFFEMRPPKASKDSQAQAVVSGRLAARLHIRVKGEVIERLAIKPFVVRTFVVGDAIPYSLAVRNEGNVDKMIEAKVTVISSSGRELLVHDVATETAVYAGAMVEKQGVLKPAATLLGRYTVRLDVHYPREGAQTNIPGVISEERTVWAVPLWLAIALVVVLGGFGMWVSWRQSVRAAERRLERKREARRARLARERAAIEGDQFQASE